MSHFRANWKKYALAAAVAAGAYYGVPPEMSESFMRGVVSVVTGQ